jgi:hypothetical protein
VANWCVEVRNHTKGYAFRPSPAISSTLSVPLRRIEWVWTLALTENRGPDPDMRGAKLDRSLVIGAHAH